MEVSDPAFLPVKVCSSGSVLRAVAKKRGADFGGRENGKRKTARSRLPELP